MLDLEFKIAPNGTVTYPAGQIIYCRPEQLKRHPENIRRFYPDKDVAEMARSIEAANGVYEAMLIVPDPADQDRFLVVNGNMRLAGARALGADCPPLKCEIISADYAGQLLIMAVTSKNHYPKDPISEGIHYKRLLAEGYSIKKIARAIGSHPDTVEGRIKATELDAPIQELMATGGLSADPRVVKSLMAIPNQAARIKLAQTVTAKKSTIREIMAAADAMTRTLGAKAQKRSKTSAAQVSLVEIKLFNALAAQLVAHLRADARLLDAAAKALPDYECDLAFELTHRAETLRKFIAAATKPRSGAVAK